MAYSHTDPITGYTFTRTFNGWPGIGLKEEVRFDRVPAPIIQVGIGQSKSTDLIISYIPEIQISDNRVSVFGFGLKHDIGKWIPGIKILPVDIAVLGAYSGFKNTFEFDETEPNNKSIFDVDNWTVQLFTSKKFSVLTVYE